MRADGVGSDGDLSRKLGPVLSFMRALWAMEHGLNARSKAMNRGLGVTGPQRLVLRVVAALGPMAPSQLARVLHIHPASVTRLARTLEARGLLTRRPDPEDGRRQMLALGPGARRVVAKGRGTVEDSIRRALRGTPRGQVATALALVGRISRALHEA